MSHDVNDRALGLQVVDLDDLPAEALSFGGVFWAK